jgi:hypothetical protein
MISQLNGVGYATRHIAKCKEGIHVPLFRFRLTQAWNFRCAKCFFRILARASRCESGTLHLKTGGATAVRLCRNGVGSIKN